VQDIGISDNETDMIVPRAMMFESPLEGRRHLVDWDVCRVSAEMHPAFWPRTGVVTDAEVGPLGGKYSQIFSLI
jgi:hypothetical protein